MITILPKRMKLLSEPENSTECHTMVLDAPADGLMFVRRDLNWNIQSSIVRVHMKGLNKTIIYIILQILFTPTNI